MNSKTKTLDKYLAISRKVNVLDDTLLPLLKYACVDDDTVALKKECLALSDKEINDLLYLSFDVFNKAQERNIANNVRIEELFNKSIISLVEKGDKNIDEELKGKHIGTLIMNPNSY